MKTVSITTHTGQPLKLDCGSFDEFPERAQHYILDSWVEHYAPYGSIKSTLRKMKDMFRKRFLQILSRSSTKLVVARYDDDKDSERIVGWSAFGPPGLVHYVYVRNVYRHGGAGHVLLACAVPPNVGQGFATHWGKGLPLSGIAEIGGTRIIYAGTDRIRGA